MWQILEPTLAIIVGLAIFTQVVLPPFINKRFFWLFRKSEKEIMSAEDELQDVTAEVRADEIKRKAKEVRQNKPETKEIVHNEQQEENK